MLLAMSHGVLTDHFLLILRKLPEISNYNHLSIFFYFAVVMTSHKNVTSLAAMNTSWSWGSFGNDLATLERTGGMSIRYQYILWLIPCLYFCSSEWYTFLLVYLFCPLQALTVLEYMVGHGSERVIDEIRERAYQISVMTTLSTLLLKYSASIESFHAISQRLTILRYVHFPCGRHYPIFSILIPVVEIKEAMLGRNHRVWWRWLMTKKE